MIKLSLRAYNTLDGTAFQADGTVERVTGFTGFSSVAEDQAGYYIAIRIEIPALAFTATDAVIWYSKDFAKSQIGAAFTAGEPNLDLIMRVAAPEAEQLTSIAFKVDWDGGGAAYAPTTYTVDLSKLLMKTAEDTYANAGIVSFESNGGTAVLKTPATLNGGKISAPVAPTKEGCVFAGWYKEDALTTAWDFANDVVRGNATLYAKWTEKADQTAPEGLAGVNTTAVGSSDGKITGTTSAMEYSTDYLFGNPAPVTCAEGETGGLAANTYYVRYKETANLSAGDSVPVRVYEICPPATTEEELIAALAAHPKVTVSGAITLTKDLTVPVGKTLEIPSIQSLAIAPDVTLTIMGAVNVTGTGVIRNNGTIVAHHQEAMEVAVKAGGAVKLGDDISGLTKSINIVRKKNIVLDLNGYTLSGNKASLVVFFVYDGTITINDTSLEKTGGVKATGADGTAFEIMGGFMAGMDVSSTVTINGGAISGNYAIRVHGMDAKLCVNGGTITSSNNAAIVGDDSFVGARSDVGTYIEINGGTLVGNTTATDRYRYCGIYHPQTGVLKITGGTVKGTNGAGVVLAGGALVMTGGTVEGRGSVEANKGYFVGDGLYTFCGGIEINYAASKPAGIGDIAISGGTVTSATSAQILQVGEKTGTGVVNITGEGIGQPVVQGPIGGS